MSLSEFGMLFFAVAGGLACLLAILRRERLSKQEWPAVVTALFGLSLCFRYAEYARDFDDWLFLVGVAGVMVLQAYNNLGFGKAGAQGPAATPRRGG